MSLLILQPEQKQFFNNKGYLLLKGFYDPEEMAEMRRQYHALVTDIDRRPKNVKYSFMDPPAGYAPDDFNPRNVSGMMAQTLAGDYWFDQFTAPRIVSAIDLPRLRTDINVLPKSCTPPPRIAPMRIHAQVGPHPK